MNIRAAFNTFYQENYKLLAHEYYDAQGVPIPNDLVTPKHVKTDSLGNEIQPGDLVSYYCDGSLSAASVGILLGFTPKGYRVVPFHTSPIPEHRVLLSHMDSPHRVFLVKSKSSPIV